jgi:hypothetical protein
MKPEHTTVYTMASFHKTGVLDLNKPTSIKCFWCRHSFENLPCACPIQYDKARNRYETDGVFCSYPCIVAYIDDSPNNIRYRDSLHLLMHMHEQTFGFYPKGTIHPAPSWQLLDDYGGHMTIQQFRDSFKTSIITETGVLNRPFTCNPITHEHSITQNWNM